MSRSQALVPILFLLSTFGTPVSTRARPADAPDLEMLTRIRDEGFHRSRVMETLAWLTDRIGPRLTGSPAMKEANEWTRAQLESWGLVNAHLEAWGPFGRGWSFTRTSVHLLAPRQVPLIALPKAWTPGTDGPVRGPVMKVKLESPEDLAKYEGKVAGKILFLGDARDLRDGTEAPLERYSEDELAELAAFAIPTGPGRKERLARYRKRWEFRRQLNPWLVEQGVLATVEASSRDGGTLRVGGGGSRRPDESPGVPGLVMAAEQYNRIARLLGAEAEGGESSGAEEPVDESPAPAVELEIDVAARFWDDDPMAYNTVAEIPGTDGSGELVMVGAHLDSWHAGTGATDNAAGSAAAMEAVRILQALGVRPRRTIRIGLWSGEEQGLLGSRAYVAAHFASRPDPEDPEMRRLPPFLWPTEGRPLTVLPEHAKLSAYFNLDNGSGRIRGIYTQENLAVQPLFEAWLAPFHDLGADTLTANDTGGTDHLSFDAVGLPGFQFIQDKLDYFSRTHHTNFDVYDHLWREDLMQSSVILASFLYQAAMRPEKLPRKPMPRE